ncbi:ulp1 protease family, C-terminal catalytic domain-containing protein [Tanacetum coccineum]
MDRQNWMYDISRSTPEYVNGVQTFLTFAETNRASSGAQYIWCPCKDCKNVCKFNNTSVIEGHLIKRGFMHKYTCWSQHCKLLIDKSSFVPVSNDHQDTSSYSNNNREDLSEMFHNLERGVGSKQPGNDIDVYLAPLIDDMKTLWQSGVEVYDA